MPMMETTPQTRSSARYRRAPTPKLSERKKKLFQDANEINVSPMMSPYVRLERIIIEEADDSDIGPMSPLEFSSSPSSFNEAHRIMARDQKESLKSCRTNFSNIMSEILNENSPRTRSKQKRIDADRANARTASKDSSEEDVVGPLCTSMKKLTSMTSMTEQNYEQLMKTPSETSTTSKMASEQVARGVSFRKSLIFDTGLTPHDDDSNAPIATKSSDEPPKAKTSLTFNEPVISVRSFYGKPSNKPVDTAADSKPEMDLLGKLNIAAILNRKAKLKPKPKPKSLAKRMKAPSLWRFSGKMKFNRHKKHRTHKIEKKTKLNASVCSNDGKFIDNNTENVPPNSGEFTSRIEQNLRLQKILKDQTNALSVSRDINWNGTTKLADSTNGHVGFLSSDDEDNEDSGNECALPSNGITYEEVEVEVEEPTNRKFFKSRATNSAKKYRIMGRLSATVKRGGDLKLDPLPKRKKNRPNHDGDNTILHNEISSIIDRLSSPSKDKPRPDADADAESDDIAAKIIEVTKTVEPNSGVEIVAANQSMTNDFIDEMHLDNATPIDAIAIEIDVNKYRQMIPYNTSDPKTESEQNSILDLLIWNGICNDETFKIFIAEPDLHKEEIAQIIDSLYCVNTLMPEVYEHDDAIEWISPVETTSEPVTLETNLNSTIETCPTPAIVAVTDARAIDEDGIIAKNQEHFTATTSHDSDGDGNGQTEKLFPIFEKNFSAKDGKVPTFNALNKPHKEWQPIGNQQYQLDVGQKEFGLRTCAQCEMQYSVHEPEDELLHLKYHNCVQTLSFKGWSNERLVTQIPDWGLDGRIIYVCEADGKAKKDRVKEVLAMVDRDLGFAARCDLKPKTLVYFAIAKQQIVGVCVVQPLELAHRLKTDNGIDCSTTEAYPVRCGISRIWVAPQYRRHGIAAKLITSMRGHFLFGAFLSFDEIAFSSPTEEGKIFAAKLTQRSDFLIYEN